MNNNRDVYEKYLQSPEWAAKREQALERDARRCRACNSPEKLEVHHRTYARLTHEDLNDLTTLCESCHEHFHRKMKQDEIMARTYSAPRSEQELTPLERERRQEQQLEDFLIGMLIMDRNLLSHVCVIFGKDDLVGEETRTLFELLQSSQPFPPELTPVVARCVETIKSAALTPGKVGNVKMAVQSATRLKRLGLLRVDTRLKELLEAPRSDANVAELRRLMKQQSGKVHQIRTMDDATRGNDE